MNLVQKQYHTREQKQYLYNSRLKFIKQISKFLLCHSKHTGIFRERPML